MIKLGEGAYRYHKKLTPFFDRLRENGFDFIHSVILIGSLADETSNNFSDVDIVLIYENYSDNYRIKKLANLVRQELRKIDYLQHHSFVMMKPLNHVWCESELPMSTLKKSSLIFNKSHELIVRFNNIHFEEKSTLNLHLIVDSLLKRIASGRTPINYYQYKSLLSQSLLLPALFCSVVCKKGIDKGNSFDLILNQNLPKHFLVWIAMASKERQEWSPRLSFLSRTLHMYSPYFVQKIFVRMPNYSLKSNLFKDEQFLFSLKSFLKYIHENY